MYLGVRAVIAKAIERIHQANLVNFAILPLTFADPADYDRIDAGDELVIAGVLGGDRLGRERSPSATPRRASLRLPPGPHAAAA